MSGKDQETRERAHRIWEQAGRPEGQQADHWHQAERELHQDASAEGETELTGTDQAEATTAAAAGEIQKTDAAEGPTEQLAEGDQLDEKP